MFLKQFWNYPIVQNCTSIQFSRDLVSCFHSRSRSMCYFYSSLVHTSLRKAVTLAGTWSIMFQQVSNKWCKQFNIVLYRFFTVTLLGIQYQPLQFITKFLPKTFANPCVRHIRKVYLSTEDLLAFPLNETHQQSSKFQQMYSRANLNLPKWYYLFGEKGPHTNLMENGFSCIGCQDMLNKISHCQKELMISNKMR